MSTFVCLSFSHYFSLLLSLCVTPCASLLLSLCLSLCLSATLALIWSPSLQKTAIHKYQIQRALDLMDQAVEEFDGKFEGKMTQNEMYWRDTESENKAGSSHTNLWTDIRPQI